MAGDWRLRGTVLIACNCDYGCPCNFNALPTYGKCEGQWTWHVEEGRFGDVVDGPRPVAYELELAEHRSRLRAGDVLDLELEPIANPVTGAEVHPGAVLPEGIVFKQGSFASARRHLLRGEISYDHSARYAAFAPFAYAGP
jgi:hypothetical protein